ncbi:MAG: hypothetical protein ABT06_00245 [Leifsonia sp. SCN 70-46]|nr:MAG: hypothetical protein ABT06_00245 [Leifsonia sp. SCN 70-46]
MVGALALLALAGCTAAPVAEPPTGAPAPPAATATATPTATPTPEPTRPAVGELIIGPAGFDQLPLGTDPASIDPAVALIEPVPLECQPDETGWYPVAAFPADASGHRPFGVAVRDSKVAGIQVVWSTEIRTAQGIGIGSTRQQLLDTYPGIGVALSDARGDVYIIQGDTGWLRFSVFYETDTVSEMLATTNDVAYYAPSYHTIDASCV